MVDYKKKYLKYKKKYLAIKKLKGGMLAKGTSFISNMTDEARRMGPSWSELKNMGSQAVGTGVKWWTDGNAPREKASRYSANFEGKTFNIFKSKLYF